jgi:transposase
LAAALRRTTAASTYCRIQAVWLIAADYAPRAVAQITGLSPRTIDRCVQRYVARRQPDALADAPRRGRPPGATGITAARIKDALRRTPWRLGYAANGWTVALLASYLSRRYDGPITPDTLRRRMRAMDLRWKRPRYVYATKDPHRAQKKGALFAA